jgi:hypothetical protein
MITRLRADCRVAPAPCLRAIRAPGSVRYLTQRLRLYFRSTREGAARAPSAERGWRKEEFLNEIGTSQSQLAHAIGVPGNRIHAIVNGTRDIPTDQVPGKRSPGSLSWGGINNTFFWIDPDRDNEGKSVCQIIARPAVEPNPLALLPGAPANNFNGLHDRLATLATETGDSKNSEQKPHTRRKLRRLVA